ncbi:sugar ABC transporter substrate-binding protein [Corynebacterium phocae]|uniref:Sugar ABC transporter substrate-binding protein n=1 Tax=Corynebacterium phocae TaxID=161895 RepID=A0A1L7D5W1_9CORY|nr:ABC transporter substrate-binding protein [Corynebacterium phocae]APT93500.1 sugar ABC transporter substrate-binding protein [Corynebacterium phocae]KAA8720580.1 ABC transporter substrate-binding protein [Corynebacterium phocae]
MKQISLKALAVITASALALTACSSSESSSDSAAGKSEGAAGESYSIGINQLVQHPALDAAAEGFKEAFEQAGVDVEWDEQNANGEQGTAVQIAQQMAGQKHDLMLAIATPAGQAMAQVIKDTPLLFTAVTDPVAAQLVASNEKPGGNITGTSDIAPIDKQVELLQKLVPGVQSIGVVYASGEVNSQVQVDELKKVAKPLGIEVKAQTVTSVTEIPQAVAALGDVDSIYVPTDNMVVSGIASLVKVANEKKIPVIGAESGTVEGGAVATLGIDYKALGHQTGEMALKILQEGADPATLPVETADSFTYVVNEEAAKAQGVEIPAEILEQAETV